MSLKYKIITSKSSNRNLYCFPKELYQLTAPKEKKGRSMHIYQKNATMYGDGCQLDLLRLSFHSPYKPQIIILYTWN